MLNRTLPNTLPSANDGNIDRPRIRLLDSNGSMVLDERLASPGPLPDTSFTIPSGVVNHDGLFPGQVLLEALDPFLRSRNFEPFVVTGMGTDRAPADVMAVATTVMFVAPDTFDATMTPITVFVSSPGRLPATVAALAFGRGGMAYGRRRRP